MTGKTALRIQIIILTFIGFGNPALGQIPPSIVINEIHVHPDLKVEQVEFVELHNTTLQTITLSDWYFSEGISFQFPVDAMLPAGGYLIVAQDPTQVITKWDSLSSASANRVYGPFSGKLSNEGERITLCDAAGRIIDLVDYGHGFPWPTVGDAVPDTAPGTGHSMQLVNGLEDNDLGGSWRSASPTPAAANLSVYQENLPPHIRQIEHTPNQPHADHTVTITAKITDADGLLYVLLHYQFVNSGQYIRITDTTYDTGWQSLTMSDDGLNGDEVAGDNIYSVQIPAQQHQHRRLVRYRVIAVDTQGHSITVPYEDDPQPNFAYFVYNGVPGWRGAIRPGAAGAEGNVVEYGTDVMRSLPVYHLLADAQDVQRCQYNQSYRDTRFLGTLVYNGEVYDHIEYKIRGEWSTYECGKNKWKFYFTRGHDFQAHDNFGQEYDRPWKVMNFSAGATPWVPAHRGMAGAGEAMAFALYSLAGVPAMNTHFLQFRVIDDAVEADPSNQYNGDLWGLYMAIEQPDGRFLDARGLPDGNIYKQDSQSGRLVQKNQSPSQTADDSDLFTFRNGYRQTNTLSWWRQNLDLERYYSFRSVNRAVNNMDLREPYNVCYYHDPLTDLWSVLPWDLDMLYMPVTHWSGVLDLQNCLRHAQLEREYHNRGRALQDLLFTYDQISQLVDQVTSVIDPPGAEQTMLDVDRAMWDWHPRTAADHRGMYYENPVRHNDFNGQSIVKTLVSADHKGVMQWIKDFMLPPPGGGSTHTGNGAFFENGWDFLDSEVADTTIPDTPKINYIGTEGYPADDLRFQTSPFSSPVTSRRFATLMWRMAEVEPNTPVSPPSPSPRQDLDILLHSESPDWRYRLGRDGEPSNPVEAWRSPEFDDDHWNQGQTSIGYGDNDDNTLLNDMQNNYTSVYLRHAFTVQGLTEIDTLTLRLYVDDGCIVWVNGQEVARVRVSPGFKAFDDLTGDDFVDNAFWQDITLDNFSDVLVEGLNIIAVHVLNSSITSSDLSFDVILSAQDEPKETPMKPPLPEAPTVIDITQPLRYEIQSLWQSEEITDVETTDIRIPAGMIEPGHTYRVRCRMKDTSGRWSHWSEPIQFIAGAQLVPGILPGLHLTEIMYHPAEPDTANGELYTDSEDYEYIEFTNLGDTEIDLSEAFFADGIEFDFAHSRITRLAPDESLLIVSHQAAFETRYGNTLSHLIAGQYDGRLSNGGERLTLKDLNEGLLLQLDYQDDWYDLTDGQGYSLTLRVDAPIDVNLKSSWQPSVDIGGSPGHHD